MEFDTLENGRLETAVTKEELVKQCRIGVLKLGLT